MAGPPRFLVLSALGLSATAVVLSALSLVKSPAAPGGTTPTPAEDARLSRLEERVEEISKGVARAEESRAAAPASPGGPAAPDASVEARVARLERAVEELDGSLAETDARTEALEAAARKGTAVAGAPSPDQVEELRGLVLDTKAEPRPRILAMRQLARVEGGRTLETARAMRALFERGEDEFTRTGSVAMLEGFTDPELESWLVDVLLNDRFSSTRESATDVLSHYTGSPQVRDALEHAAANDSNHDVRADAQNALDKLDERERNR